MSTSAHQALRDRLAARLGGTWARDAVSGEHVLSIDGGRPVRLIPEDLALTRRDRLWEHLRRLSARRERLAVLVSLAPLGDRAATLLARDVWRAMLQAAGLRVVDAVPAEAVGDAAAWHAAWRRIDPYRHGDDRCLGLLLEPDTPMPEAEGAALARRLLGPQVGEIADGPRVGVLVSGYQDFHTLQPWLARLADDRRCVLLRDSRLGQAPAVMDHLRAALAPYDPLPLSLDGDPRAVLAEADLDVLVSASESPANLAHLGNAATLLLARSLGIATAHAQHGIWPRAEFPPPVTSVADLVLAWADEYREVIAPPTPVDVTGAPRFDRYADPVHRHVSGLYGAWTGAYRRHVVLATNLHWTQHTTALDAGGLVASLATRFPDTLFTLKPHPYEVPPDAEALPTNVVVLAQDVMLAAGIEPADVVEAADFVLTTPSTFALEAALAGRPCLVLETGNANRHDHLHEAAATSVEAWLERPVSAPGDEVYAARYCEPHTRGQAFERARSALQQLAGTATLVTPSTANVVQGLLDAVVRLGHDQVHLREHRDAAMRDVAEATRYVESLRWTVDRKDRYIAHLHARFGITPS